MFRFCINYSSRSCSHHLRTHSAMSSLYISWFKIAQPHAESNPCSSTIDREQAETYSNTMMLYNTTSLQVLTTRIIEARLFTS